MTVVRLGQREEKPRTPLLRRRVTPITFLLVILGLVVFRLWVVETAIVEGKSMLKTLSSDDRVLVLKLLGLKRFDVVVLTDPQAHETVIKRIVAVPGDTVSMVPRVRRARGRTIFEGSQLYINGKPYDEPYATSTLPTVVSPAKLGPGSYYVLGDNRDDSVDSRAYGPVKRKDVHGVAVLVYYPFSRMGLVPRRAVSPGEGTPATSPSS